MSKTKTKMKTKTKAKKKNPIAADFKWPLLIAVVALTLIFDQWTKHLVHTGFRWGESRAIFDSWFALTYVRNSGAAFGMLHRAPPAFRDPFFLIIPLVVVGAILFLYRKLDEKQRISAFALSLVVGGAIGNLIDRLRFGYVIDFIDVHWKEIYHWPAFNIADSCIVVGVAILFLLSVFRPKEAALRT